MQCSRAGTDSLLPFRNAGLTVKIATAAGPGGLNLPCSAWSGGLGDHSAGFPARQILSSIRPLQFIDVDFLHLKHCLHGSLGFFRIGAIDHLEQSVRYNLP
jgi:hypothetical protein